MCPMVGCVIPQHYVNKNMTPICPSNDIIGQNTGHFFKQCTDITIIKKINSIKKPT
jgi:hypothetical protein